MIYGNAGLLTIINVTEQFKYSAAAEPAHTYF